VIERSVRMLSTKISPSFSFHRTSSTEAVTNHAAPRNPTLSCKSCSLGQLLRSYNILARMIKELPSSSKYKAVGF
jgi:hypothetical protein